MTNTFLPLKWNSPTSGFRLDVQTGLVGSMRPGERVNAGAPWLVTICVPVVDRLPFAGPASTNQTVAGL
jgi:hypothetical protein